MKYLRKCTILLLILAAFGYVADISSSTGAVPSLHEITKQRVLNKIETDLKTGNIQEAVDYITNARLTTDELLPILTHIISKKDEFGTPFVPYLFIIKTVTANDQLHTDEAVKVLGGYLTSVIPIGFTTGPISMNQVYQQFKILIQTLINAGVTFKNSLAVDILTIFIRKGTAFFRVLIDSNAFDLNAADADGNTVLIKAVMFRNYDAVRDLLKLGANPLASNKAELSVLDIANQLRGPNADEIRVLINDAISIREQQAHSSSQTGATESSGAGQVSTVELSAQSSGAQ